MSHEHAQGHLRACYCHAVATLQVKNLPDELHAGLRERASREGLTMSDYVTRLVRRDLRRPAMNEWLDSQLTRPTREDVDAVAVLDEVRDDN